MGLLSSIKKVVEHVTEPWTMFGAPSVIDTVGNVGQDVVDNLSGKKAQQRAEEAAREQQEREQMYWYQQQEYNTPANQVARLKASGLNPNLFYSQGNTGNASSQVHAVQKPPKADKVGNLLRHSFNGLQMLNSLQMAKTNILEKQAQMEYQKEVLDFQKNQAAIQNAFRAQEQAYKASHTQQQYEQWLREYDERVRHNKAMEGKLSTMSMLDSLSMGLSGRHATDVITEAGRMEKAYLNWLFSPVTKPVASAWKGATKGYYKLKYW